MVEPGEPTSTGQQVAEDVCKLGKHRAPLADFAELTVEGERWMNIKPVATNRTSPMSIQTVVLCMCLSLWLCSGLEVELLAQEVSATDVPQWLLIASAAKN